MPNRAFSASRYGQGLAIALQSARPSLSFMGDSYGQYMAAAIKYACSRYYQADILFNTNNYAGGGNFLSIGGTSTAQMIATQVPQFQARLTDIVVICSGHNDGPNNDATALASAANMVSASNSCLAAGAKLVILISSCAGGAAEIPIGILAFNSLLINYARNTSGVTYIDIPSVLVDPTSVSTTSVPFRGVSGAIGGYSYDGTHPSGTGCRAIAPLFTPLLQNIARKRVLRASVNGGIYDPATKPNLNVFGDAGLIIGTSGQLNSVNNAAVGGVANSKINIITNGVTATPSIVLGADGFNKQRITMSGLATAGNYMIVQFQPNVTAPNNGDATRLYDMEAMVELNAVTGLCDFMLQQQPVNDQGISWTGGVGGANPSHRYPDATTESQIIYNTHAATMAGGNPDCRITFLFDNANLAGSIDISRVSCQRVAV